LRQEKPKNRFIIILMEKRSDYIGSESKLANVATQTIYSKRTRGKFDIWPRELTRFKIINADIFDNPKARKWSRPVTKH